MALNPNIPLQVQTPQIQSPMQGAQQMLTLRELMMGAQAQEARRDQYRLAQAQAARQQRADQAFMQAWQQSGGRMTPDVAALGLQSGRSPAELQSMAGMRNWGRSKVAGQFETVGPDGRPVTMFRDEYGQTVGEGHVKPVKLSAQNLGGEIGFFNEYTGAEGAPRVAKSPEQTELEKLMVARGIAPGSAQWNQTISDYLHKKTSPTPAPTVNVSNFIQPATPGQESADKKYAQDFVEFATGGYADVVKQLDQLREVSTALGSGQNLTGPIIGSMPNSVLAATNPRALSTKEMVEEVVQRNLRIILGTQFTEKEGERLIARAYNPRLSEAENKIRVDRLMQQISEAAKAKLDAAQYFQEHGSLVGWKGRLPKMSDFDPEKEPSTGGASSDFGGSAQTEFDAMPDPAKYKGQTMLDQETGITYRSDGKSWKRVQ